MKLKKKEPPKALKYLEVKQSENEFPYYIFYSPLFLKPKNLKINKQDWCGTFYSNPNIQDYNKKTRINYLLSDDGRYSILGFLALALGIEDSTLKNQIYLEKWILSKLPPNSAQYLNTIINTLGLSLQFEESKFGKLLLVQRIKEIEMAYSVSISDKEVMLKELFKSHLNINLEFSDFEEST
jgi:hypothetical protein